MIGAQKGKRICTSFSSTAAAGQKSHFSNWKNGRAGEIRTPDLRTPSKGHPKSGLAGFPLGFALEPGHTGHNLPGPSKSMRQCATVGDHLGHKSLHQFF